MTESPAFDSDIPSAAEIAADRFLQSMPPGCTLETTTALTPEGWEATACLENPSDTPRPQYVGRGPTETMALLNALHYASRYWLDRVASSRRGATGAT